MFSVIAQHQLQLDASSTDKTLKQLLSQQIPQLPRRMDRLAILTLLLAAPFRGQLKPDCGIYLAADYPSLANMYALLDTVVVQQQLPKPFEFVNSVSNAACFYAAQILQLDGPNVFIGAGHAPWQALAEFAYADLHCNIVSEALLIRCWQGGNQLGGQVLQLAAGNWQPQQWLFSEFVAAM